MLLAIDAGNTNTVFAIFHNQEKRGEWRISTDGKRTADEYALAVTQLMAMGGLSAKDIDAVIISTVVPQNLFALRGLARSCFGCEAMVIGDGSVELGISVQVERSQEVGADRLVNAVAAHQEFGGPAIVIDFGTATTFDVINATGDYCGGVIAPGINLSLEALHRAAAKLPEIAVMRPPQVVGTSTVSAMQSGIYWGYVGLIEGITARIKQEYGSPMTTIATGGLAPLFIKATDAIDHLSRDLTMQGLRLIYERN